MMAANLSALERLSDRSLRGLAGALESGRLAPPFEALALRRVCGEVGAVDQVGAELDRLASQGWSLAQIATLVLAMADARQAVHARQKVDLVWTGPEVDGAPSRDTVVVVSELFQHAQRSVLIAGYVVYDGRRIFETLARRMDEDPSLDVRMFLNIERRPTVTSLASELVAAFVERFREKDWPGKRLPAIYYDPRSLELEPAKRASLHAKCIVVDDRISFVSSANFTEAALERNVEAGVRIESEDFADHLERHFEGLVGTGAMQRAI